jgi:hypothetical protein
MDSDIEEEIIQKHNQAEVFISLFFAAVDIIGYITILIQFGCAFKKACSLIQKLYGLIILDGVLRIINLEITSFVYSFPKEILMSIFATIQFYLIINILFAIFEDKRIQNVSAGYMGILEDKILLLCCFFFCSLVFIFSKMFSLIQYISCLCALCGFGYMMNKKTNLFLESVSQKYKNFKTRYFIQNLILFTGFYFFIYYVIKILSLFIENPLYCSYIQMTYDVFKEIGKYLAFIFVSIILYLYNKYIYTEDNDFQTESQVQSTGVY